MRRTLPLLLLLAVVLVGGLWYVVREPGSASGDGVQAALAPGGPAGGRADGALPGPTKSGNSVQQAEANSSTRSGIEIVASAATEAAGAEEQAPPRVVGRLVDERGDGLAGAHVDMRRGEVWLSLPADLEPVGGLAQGRHPRRAETDDEGHFFFEDVEPGDYDFALRAPGHAPLDRARQRVPVHERFDLGELVLRRGVVLAGRVIDGKGEGVADVLVLRAASPEGGSLRLSVPGFGAPAGRTAADGSFRVDTVAPGGWHLIFDSPRHRVVELHGRTENAGAVEDGLLVRMESGLGISGRVEGLDPLERPLRVVARPADEQPSAAGDSIDGSERARPRYAPVTPDGSFALLGLAPSIQYLLRLEREREPDLEARPDEVAGPRFAVLPEVDSVLAMAGAREVVLERVATATVSYRLVDAESGAPITRGFASIQGDGSRNGRLRGGGVVEDAAGEPLTEHPGGRVVHDELRPSGAGVTAIVRVNADGYAPYEGDGFLLKPGEERDLGDLELRPAPGVAVRVVDEATDEPIAGARVLIAPAGESETIRRYLDPTTESEPRTGTPVRLALTDESGRCRITARGNEVCVLRASHVAHLASEEARSLPPHGDEVELRLAPAGSVLVRVVDPRANPIAGVYVQHEGPDGEVRRSPWDTEARARQTSDEAGLVRFDRLEAGRHRFEVAPDSDPFGRSNGQEPEASEECVVVEGGETELELRLEERGGLRAILLEAGVPLTGARAQLTDVDAGPQRRNFWRGPGMSDPTSAISDHEGRIELNGLAVKRYTLSVSHPSRRMSFETEVQVEPDPRETRIELGLASVEGRVTGELGEPLEGLRVSVASGDGARDFGNMDFRLILSEDEDGDVDYDMNEVGERRVETDHDGRYVLRGVRPDAPLTVQIQGSFVVGDSATVDALARDEVRRGVDFSLRAAGQLEIELTGLPQGSRTRYGVRLEHTGQGGGRRNETIQPWRPRRTVSSLLPGTWKIVVFRGKDVAGSAEAEVSAGTSSKVVIQVQ